MLRTTVLALVLIIPAVSCDDAGPAAPTEPSSAAPVALAPWETVDPAFAACAGACGARGETPGARAQPGVANGDLAYCPVSGAAFTVTDESPAVDHAGERYHFCCAACAAYFASNAERVIAARGPLHP